MGCREHYELLAFFKGRTLGVVFCSLFLGHDETHHSGLLLAALGRGVEEGVEQEGRVMPVGHQLCSHGNVVNVMFKISAV